MGSLNGFRLRMFMSITRSTCTLNMMGDISSGLFGGTVNEIFYLYTTAAPNGDRSPDMRPAVTLKTCWGPSLGGEVSVAF